MLLFIAEKIVDDLALLRGSRIMSAIELASFLFGVFLLLIILRVPVAFALGVACIPVFFIDDRLTPFLLLNEMMKSYNSFILLAIPFFILSANLMNSAGVTQRLMDLARTMVGQFPGGLGHVNVVVSMIFAGISGSSTAEAAGIGGVMIPAMKKQGYDTNFTVALTACAAVMGVIIPPSILMVVWGGVISVSIGALFLAGVLPGVMIGAALMGAVYVYAKRRGYPVYARATLHEFFCAAWRALLPLATPAIIVGGITGGIFTPTEASVDRRALCNVAWLVRAAHNRVPAISRRSFITRPVSPQFRCSASARRRLSVGFLPIFIFRSYSSTR